MADTLVLGSQQFLISTDVAYIEFKIWGGGGAGENVNDLVNPFVRGPGGDGGDTTFLGLTAGGGKGGNLQVTDAGKGGVATDVYGWGNRGVTLTIDDGENAAGYADPALINVTDNSKGEGGKIGNNQRGNGGNGDLGRKTYVSNVTHVFNNTTDVTQDLGNSPDITVTPQNLTSDGENCGKPSNGKHYSIDFVTNYINSDYSLSISNIQQQAAGGGTNGAPYTLDGTGNKNASGFDVWFCASGATTTLVTGETVTPYGGYCETCPSSLEYMYTLPGNCGTNQDPKTFIMCGQRFDTYTTYETPKNTFIRSFTITTTGQKIGVIGMGGGGGAAISGTITRAQFEASDVYSLGSVHDIVSGTGGQTTGIGGTVPAEDGGDGSIELFIVYKPRIEFYNVSATEIKKGECVTFSWRTIGDADTFVWTEGNIANVLLTSTETVCPQESTNYTARANGLGGFSDFFTLRIEVYELPTGSVDVPVSVDYGVESFDIEYTVNYANIQNTLDVIYLDVDGVSTVHETIQLEVNNTALANSEPIDYTRTETISYTPDWNDKGPRYIQFRLNVEGDGGTAQFPDSGGYYDTFVVIDETPDNILVPDTVGVIKSDPDVRSPSEEEGPPLLTDLMYVNDIDIPVEVSAGNPIKVRVNNQGEWFDLRDTGIAPGIPQGKSIEEDEEIVEIVEGPFESVQFAQEEEITERSSNLEVEEADPDNVKKLALYATSLDIPGYSAYDHPAWSGFMNQYATHPYDTSSDANNLPNGTGGINFTATYSGDYTITAAVDNVGTACLNGTCTRAGGFRGNGNSTSRFYSAGSNVNVTWDFYNTTGSSNFDSNPCAMSWKVEGPDQPAAPGASLDASGSGIIAGNCVTLTWSSSGNRNSASASWRSSPGFSGSDTICPDITTTYTYTVCGEGGCTTVQEQVVVYIPPTVNFYADKYYIKNGESVTLYWATSGDANTLVWVAGNLSNTLLTSQTTVTPATTTTYTLRVSGAGGTSPDYSVTIVVYEPPEGDFSVPAVIDYGTASFDVEWEAKYANIKVRLRITTIDLDNNNVVTNEDLPLANSAEAGQGADNDTSGTYTHTPTWGNRGPSLIRFALELEGDGGNTTLASQDVLVNIDQTPDNILIPDSIGVIKSFEPVISPEGDVLSDLLLVDDVDIPVEVKATNPILVSVNNDQNTWQKIRSFGAPAVPVGNDIEEDAEIVEVEVESVSTSSEPEELQVVEANPNIVRTAAHGDIDYANLITCISIIDESSPSATTHSNDWASFRNNYPDRTFYLLQATFRTDPPQGNPIYGLNRLNRPSNFLNDPYAYTVQVNRDDETVNISDWFTICGLQNVPAGSYVSVWLDISGSMREVDVANSKLAFEAKCAQAGIIIILETSDSGERWIPGHNKDLPPSGFISSDKSQVKEGEQFELTWVAFGEVTQVTITNYNNNQPLTFTGHDDLTITATTTFTMTISGTTGATTTRSVTVTLIPKPVFNIYFQGDTSLNDIVRKPGVNTQLNWSTTPTGSGETLTWTSGNLANVLLTSQEIVSPADTITYCGYVTGPGGTSDTKCATIRVSQYVTLSGDAPGTIDYGTATVTTSYTTKYSDISMKLEVFFTYLDGSSSNTPVFTDDTLLHPTSYELNPTAPDFNEVADEEIDFDMSGYWNDIGPSVITFRYTAEGTAGTEVVNITTLVNIDQTPDNFLIPDSIGLIKNEEPVISPEDGPLDTMLPINDIDVPVEILSNYPIKVQKNLDGSWVDVRDLDP